jgi:hypothetical protein
MMALAAEDSGSGQQWQRQTMTAADDNSMQDRVADYNKEGQERAAREGGDSGVAMMAAVVEDDGGRRQQWWRTMTATADDDSGRRQMWRMMMARKIGWQTMRGKEESGWRTTTTLGIRLISPPGSRAVKKIRLTDLKGCIRCFGGSKTSYWTNCT